MFGHVHCRTNSLSRDFAGMQSAGGFVSRGSGHIRSKARAGAAETPALGRDKGGDSVAKGSELLTNPFSPVEGGRLCNDTFKKNTRSLSRIIEQLSVVPSHHAAGQPQIPPTVPPPRRRTACPRPHGAVLRAVLSPDDKDADVAFVTLARFKVWWCCFCKITDFACVFGLHPLQLRSV